MSFKDTSPSKIEYNDPQTDDDYPNQFIFCAASLEENKREDRDANIS